jgi:hypothetical protein
MVQKDGVGFAGGLVGEDIQVRAAVPTGLGAVDQPITIIYETAHTEDVVEVISLHIAKFHALFDDQHIGGMVGVWQHRAAGDLALDHGWRPGRRPGRQ